MPSIIHIANDNKSIELQEFIDRIEKKSLNFSDHDDLIYTSTYLNQLNNNKKFLINFLGNELSNIATFQKSNVHNSGVFNIYQTKSFLLRAVVWNPISEEEKANKNFKYDVFHDHNFDLLTIGYFGPGYKTRSFTYEQDNVIGLLGEKVEMEDKGIYQLTEGTIFLYKAKFDIHNQIPPDTLSVSLNIIPKMDIITRPQYEFDEDELKICRYIQVSSNELNIRLAGIIGDKNDIEILRTIMTKNSNPHIKAYAASSIVQIDSTLYEPIYDWIANTNDPLVKDLFLRERISYGSCI